MTNERDTPPARPLVPLVEIVLPVYNEEALIP
jgi:hypothetical protein